MPSEPQRASHTIHIPLRVIKHKYGVGNLDVAGDDIVNALREVSDFPNQFKYRFDLDACNTNLWYHTLVFSIEAMPDSNYAHFMRRLIELGLVGCE